MLSSVFKGVALVMLWVCGALIYQAVLHGEDYAMPIAESSKRKGKPVLLEIKVMDAELDREAKDLETQLNEMAIEVIELQMTKGIPNGYE